MILSITYFIIVTLCLSFILDLFVEWNPDFFEQFFMRIGFGLAFLSVLGVILDLLYIPINAWIILAISVLFPALKLYENGFSKEDVIDILDVSTKKKIFYSIILLLFLVTAYMYISGSFSYTYMENGDPWGYTAVSKVIAEEETFKADYRYNHYSEPYTQGYQIVMGVLHQTNDSMYVTMKFFHNLILALSIPFFYFVARRIFPSKEEYALFSTIALFSIPSWVTHFIFSLSYNMVLFLLFLYSLFKINQNGWKYISGLVLGSLLVNHIYTATIAIIVLALFYFFKVIHSGKLHEEFIDTGYIGLATSLLFFVPSSLRHSYYFDEFVKESHGGLEKILFPLINTPSLLYPLIIALIAGFIALRFKHYWKDYVTSLLRSDSLRYSIYALFYGVIGILTFIPTKLINIEGTASRSYSFGDFWNADPSMINNTVGWGPVIFLLIAVAVITILLNYKKLRTDKQEHLFIISNVFLILLWLVFGMDHSILIMTFRIWTFLAIFSALLAGYGLYLIYKATDSFDKKTITYLIVITIIAVMVWTSFLPKYQHNTSSWPESRIMVPQSYSAYTYMRSNLPSDVNAVRLCGKSEILASYDAYPPLKDPRITPQWRGGPENTTSLQEEIYNMSSQQIYTELNERDVEFVVLGLSCIVEQQENQQALQRLLTRLSQDARFSTEYRTQTEFVLRLE